MIPSNKDIIYRGELVSYHKAVHRLLYYNRSHIKLFLYDYGLNIDLYNNKYLSYKSVEEQEFHILTSNHINIGTRCLCYLPNDTELLSIRFHVKNKFIITIPDFYSMDDRLNATLFDLTA